MACRGLGESAPFQGEEGQQGIGPGSRDLRDGLYPLVMTNIAMGKPQENHRKMVGIPYLFHHVVYLSYGYTIYIYIYIVLMGIPYLFHYPMILLYHIHYPIYHIHYTISIPLCMYPLVMTNIAMENPL